MKGSSVRDAITIETKTFNPMDSGHDHGLSPVRIRRQIDTSLTRLGVERIALYLAHEFDPDTPQVETLKAFDALVRAGKVGAVGASNFTGEQLAEAIEIAELARLKRYEWVQNSFSLLERENAKPCFPSARHTESATGVRTAAGGWLTGKCQRGERYPGIWMTKADSTFCGARTTASSTGGIRG